MQDRKVLAEPLTELETDRADPRDQDIKDLTLAAQGEDRGVPCAVVNDQQVKDSNPRPKEICPARELDVVTKLSTPSVIEAGEAAVLSVKLPACLTSTVTRANDIWAAATTPRRSTLQKPLTKLLGRLGLALTLLLLTPATSKTSTPSASPTATKPTAATAATSTAASTAATNTPTPATTPTAATTSIASTTSTAAPTTTPAAPSTIPAILALAAAALCTSRSSSD
ncbi:unnamed protein product, partial [Closterium sp. NIES-53]